jgi:hypothetical protein
VLLGVPLLQYYLCLLVHHLALEDPKIPGYLQVLYLLEHLEPLKVQLAPLRPQLPGFQQIQ